MKQVRSSLVWSVPRHKWIGLGLVDDGGCLLYDFQVWFIFSDEVALTGPKPKTNSTSVLNAVLVGDSLRVASCWVVWGPASSFASLATSTSFVRFRLWSCSVAGVLEVHQVVFLNVEAMKGCILDSFRQDRGQPYESTSEKWAASDASPVATQSPGSLPMMSSRL